MLFLNIPLTAACDLILLYSHLEMICDSICMFASSSCVVSAFVVVIDSETDSNARVMPALICYRYWFLAFFVPSLSAWSLVFVFLIVLFCDSWPKPRSLSLGLSLSRLVRVRGGRERMKRKKLISCKGYSICPDFVLKDVIHFVLLSSSLSFLICFSLSLSLLFLFSFSFSLHSSFTFSVVLSFLLVSLEAIFCPTKIWAINFSSSSFIFLCFFWILIK